MQSNGFKSVAQKILSERGARIEVLTLRDQDSKDRFFYLLMGEDDFVRMQKDLTDGIKIFPNNYGLVFFEGEGKKASPEVESRIQDIMSKFKR